MIDRLGVEAFRAVVEAGTVREDHSPSKKASGRLPSWVWFLGARHEVKHTLELLSPHLVVKREDAEIALRFLRGVSIPEWDSACEELRARKTRRPGGRLARLAS